MYRTHGILAIGWSAVFAIYAMTDASATILTTYSLFTKPTCLATAEGANLKPSSLATLFHLSHRFNGNHSALHTLCPLTNAFSRHTLHVAGPCTELRERRHQTIPAQRRSRQSENQRRRPPSATPEAAAVGRPRTPAELNQRCTQDSGILGKGGDL